MLRNLTSVCHGPLGLFIVLLTYGSKFTLASRGFAATAWLLFSFDGLFPYLATRLMTLKILVT